MDPEQDVSVPHLARRRAQVQRVLVLGVSSGAGKSTFARHLGALTGLPVYHLDALFWKPGWLESTPEEFLCRQQQVVQQDRWIIEGNYTSAGYDLRTARADTLIYLEVGLLLCVYRIYKRRLAYRNQSRIDMAPGCPEKVDWAFLRFILTTYHRRRRNMTARLQSFEALGDGRRAIWLKGPRCIAMHMRQLQHEPRDRPFL